MRQFLRGAIAGGVGAAVVMVATAAVAGTGIGGVFNLGKTNTVNATTSLTGSTSGAQLGITNSGAGPALALNVASGKPPLAVNSSTRVKNLNSAYLNGFTPNQFVQGGGQVRGFSLTLTHDSEQDLLAIPGYGMLFAECDGGTGGTGALGYRNGSHHVDVSTWSLNTFNGADVAGYGVNPSGVNAFFGTVGAGTLGQGRMLLHYTTTSGLFTIQHVATVDAAVQQSADGTLCTFVASTVAGATGRFAP
jgi:hypothetical protein